MVKIVTIDGRLISDGREAYDDGYKDGAAGKPRDDEAYLEPYHQIQYGRGWATANYYRQLEMNDGGADDWVEQFSAETDSSAERWD